MTVRHKPFRPIDARDGPPAVNRAVSDRWRVLLLATAQLRAVAFLRRSAVYTWAGRAFGRTYVLIEIRPAAQSDETARICFFS